VEAVGDIQYRPVIIDENRAVESALANRSEVLSAERQVQLAEGNVGLARSQNDFRLDLTARYGLSKNSEEFQNTFNDFNRTRGALLSVSIPIFDWGSHSLSVEAAQVQQTNAVDAVAYTRQQVRQEILDLVNRIRVAESRIQVLEKAVEVAQKGYDISLQRFGNGAITRNDLALTQQRLTTAKTNSLNALIDYKLGLADLQRKTLYDFERQEPVRPVMVPEE
jgi:outer membrane protein TolC